MVYCGKASQGCQNCRTRRIKCDKVRPECSQCIRAGKKCPGYRDQLSLMFRDESSKVMQKAHAQWAPSDQAGSSTSAWSSSPDSVPDRRSRSSSAESTRSHALVPAKIYQPVTPNLEDQGLNFYISHYLMNHPDAPKSNEELATDWLYCPATSATMKAVGLACLGNLKEDGDMKLVARQNYGVALQETGKLLQSMQGDVVRLHGPLRAIVSLALYETVSTTSSLTSTFTAKLHIYGAIALVRSMLPLEKPITRSGGLIQIMFAVFIPCHVTNTPLPAPFFDALNVCGQYLPPKDGVCWDLAQAIGSFLNISAYLKENVLIDRSGKTTAIMKELLDVEDVLDAMEENIARAYPFGTQQGDFPSEAVFHGKYHVYSDIWGTRMWNHYRWVRINVNQMILEYADKYPISSLPIISASWRIHCFDLIRRMAEETIISTPSQWRHPVLPEELAKSIEASQQGGSGAVGLPCLLWHLKVASCAPGVPGEFLDWSYDIMQCIWRNMGMQHARALAEVMDDHRRSLEREVVDRT